jgi:hypothetical protein
VVSAQGFTCLEHESFGAISCSRRALSAHPRPKRLNTQRPRRGVKSRNDAAWYSGAPNQAQNPMPGATGGFNNNEINGKSRNPDTMTPGTGPANANPTQNQ